MWKWIIGIIWVIYSIFDAALKSHLTKSCLYAYWCFFGDLLGLYLFLTHKKLLLAWYLIFIGISIVLYLITFQIKSWENKIVNENEIEKKTNDEVSDGTDHT